MEEQAKLYFNPVDADVHVVVVVEDITVPPMREMTIAADFRDDFANLWTESTAYIEPRVQEDRPVCGARRCVHQLPGSCAAV